MKLCLGIMTYNDAHWLRLHLPTMLSVFDGVVAVDDSSTDGTPELLQHYNVHMFNHHLENSWSEQFNHVIGHAEALGYDMLVRLDPDELLWPYDVHRIRILLKDYKLLWLSRYNFWKDRIHYTPSLFPDWQARAWQLNKGIRLIGQVHETVNYLDLGFRSVDPWKDEARDMISVPDITIYHYGGVAWNTERFKLYNYNTAMRSTGGALIDKYENLPTSNKQDPERHSIPFSQAQPIAPHMIGITAPFYPVSKQAYAEVQDV